MSPDRGIPCKVRDTHALHIPQTEEFLHRKVKYKKLRWEQDKKKKKNTQLTVRIMQQIKQGYSVQVEFFFSSSHHLVFI